MNEPLKITLSQGEQQITVTIPDATLEVGVPGSLDKPTELIDKYWSNAVTGVERFRNYWLPRFAQKERDTGRRDGIAGQNYDGAWVHHWLGEYLGVANGACELMHRWVEPYATSRPNSVAPGHFNYNRGPIAMGYYEVGIRFADHSAYSRPGRPVPTTPDLAREVANAMMAHIQANKARTPTQQHMVFMAECASALRLYHIPTWIRVCERGDLFELSQPQNNVAPFIMSLAARSLIEYDPDRSVVILQRLADAIYPVLWRTNAKGGGFLYRHEFDDQGDPINEINPAPDLALMVFPLFAWLWDQTKAPKYRDIANDLFALGINHAWLKAYKHFNQSYVWSHEGMRWMGWLALD